MLNQSKHFHVSKAPNIQYSIQQTTAIHSFYFVHIRITFPDLVRIQTWVNSTKIIIIKIIKLWFCEFPLFPETKFFPSDFLIGPPPPLVLPLVWIVRKTLICQKNCFPRLIPHCHQNMKSAKAYMIYRIFYQRKSFARVCYHCIESYINHRFKYKCIFLIL